MDSVEAKVFSHPLRVRILAALRASPATAVQLSRDLKQSLSKVVYHLTVLCDTSYVRKIEAEDGSPDPLYELIRY
ncbi:MAG TPA: helix-turn-helix domain-containing protein [Solirubrobacterales bacterium]|nr:helix-turn-helix domain-containing protein [Solirubrobacterales bacterium]